MRARAPLAAALLALLAACGGDVVDPGDFSLTGEWSGTSAPYTFALDLRQSGEDVEGTGTVSAPAGSLDVEVDGSWDHPAVELVLRAPGFQDLTFAGQFARSDSIAGTLSGSGLDGRQLSLLRLPAPEANTP
ncbi:MAG TPA: hypothetical protein VFX98_14590 [Longimicrobiaceae bacterium]|nr:hypothetical protein [Longimicrobiaceae bacterium]